MYMGQEEKLMMKVYILKLVKEVVLFYVGRYFTTRRKGAGRGFLVQKNKDNPPNDGSRKIYKEITQHWIVAACPP